MARILIVFDPGWHTGVAWFSNGGLKRVSTVTPEDKAGWVGQYVQLREYLVELDAVASALPPIVVIENYRTVVAPGTDGMHTIKLLGFLQGCAAIRGLEIVLQMPPVKKPWLDVAYDVMHETFPKYRPTPHERDAVAHGLAYLFDKERHAR